MVVIASTNQLRQYVLGQDVNIYSEVLLIAAEAANELEAPASAAPYLREIRNRAFAPADRPIKVDAYFN